MSARINLGKDEIPELAAKFKLAPLNQPVFLNSVPKSGTHLLTHIVRMFVSLDRQWTRAFIQLPNLKPNFTAFSPTEKYLSWGHLVFHDESALALKPWVKHVVLVRDPYSWVTARARFYLSEEFQGTVNHLKNGSVTVNQLLNLMIFGIVQEVPSLFDLFTLNAVAWMGTGARIVKYEDIRKHLKTIDSPESEAFFRELLADCGIEKLPNDWRERVMIGSDPAHSGTARENLSGAIDIPDELPETQKKLVDFAAPGLRKILGYE